MTKNSGYGGRKMDKITITEALEQKIPLPWKVSEGGETKFLVYRQRPEQLTRSAFYELEQYGLKRNEIRELFYVMSNDWSQLLKSLDIAPLPKECPKKVIQTDTVAEISKRLSNTPAADLPKVPIEKADANEGYGWVLPVEKPLGNNGINVTIDLENADGDKVRDLLFRIRPDSVGQYRTTGTLHIKL
jgi:hypothetical protein